MSTYHLTIRIDQSLMKQLRQSKVNLCCAFGFKAQESKVEYNVIAWAEDPTPINLISWTDKYYMAAAKRGIEDDALITPNVTALPVNFGQTFSLTEDWMTLIRDDSSRNKEKVPWMQFETGIPSSGMVFKQVRKRVVPVYALSMGPVPMIPGHYKIEPTGSVALFFASKEEATAFDMGQISDNAFRFNYIESQDFTPSVSFTALGTWVMNPNEAEDWTKGLLAKL